MGLAKKIPSEIAEGNHLGVKKVIGVAEFSAFTLLLSPPTTFLEFII
jgi:hypothetical protein